MQFSGAFWATLQRFQMSNHVIDQLLARENTTLHEVLSYDMIVQETRNQNPKLLEFLTHERILELLEYITIFPDESADESRTTTHPFIVCEMLSESGQIHERIADSPELLQKLFNFLNEQYLHPTLLGYFSKCVLALISKCPDKVFEYMGQNNVFSKLLDHIGCKSILDIVAKTLVVDLQQTEAILNSQKEILKSLVACISFGSEYRVLYSAVLISEILTRAMEINSWKDLISVVLDTESLNVYYDQLFSAEKFRSIAAAGVLKTIFAVNIKSNLSNYIEGLDHVKIFIASLPRFKEFLERPNEESVCVNTIMENFVPLGEARLRVIELVAVVMRYENERVFDDIGESGIIPVISAIFFKYPWHSMLHTAFDNIVQPIVQFQNPSLISSLFINSNFVETLIKICESDNQHRLGYLGFLNKFSNQLKALEIESLKSLLSASESWSAFNTTYLDARNELDSKQLGEVTKKEEVYSSSSDEQEIALNLPSSILNKKVYSKTQKPVEHQDPGESVAESHGDENSDQFAEVIEKVIEEKCKETEEKGEGNIEEVKKGLEIDVEESKEVNQNKSPRNRASPRGIVYSPKYHPPRPLSNNPSPKNDPNFNCMVYWKTPLCVDEIDDLDDLV